MATENPGFSKSRAARTRRAHREILLRRGKPRAKESAHQRAWKHVEALRERANRRDARRREEERLEEAPAVLRHAGEVHRELAERLALNVFAARRHQIAAQLAPSVRFANVDELTHAGRSERQHRVRRRAVELREQRDGRHARKFAHERGDAGARALIAARDRHENGADAIRFEILNELGDRVAMDRVVRSFAGGVDANALGRCEHRCDRER